jgi:hypothetical protein
MAFLNLIIERNQEMKTKRNLFRICILSAVLLLSLTAQGQFAFTTNNGVITITGYTGTSGNVIIPDMIDGYPVISIGGFYSAISLTNITILDSVTNIASGVFVYLSSLTAIMVDENNSYYSSSNGVLFDKQQTVLIQAPGGMAGSYAIPTTVTNIGDQAFYACGSLTNVSIGTNVTGIGANAFNFCTSLSNITIPGSVADIGSGAFAVCQSLTAITVDQQNLFYSSTNGILLDKLQTTLIQAPGGIAGSPAIPGNVTSIGTGAFLDCTRLTGITVPDSVTNIGSQAFYFCGSLTNLTLGTNLMSIGDDAFYSCSGLTSLTIPNCVIGIGNAAFGYCGGLTNLTLGTNLTSLGDNAFYYCSVLTSLTIPNCVIGIGNAAFGHCGSLTNLTLGTNVTSIGSDAFASCSNLTSIAIPSSVTNIVLASAGIVRIGMGALLINGPMEMVANCSRLTAITVDEQNLFYSSAHGILFNKPQTTLLEAPGALAGSYAIPGSVTSIGAEAFQNCAGLTGVSIPNSVTNIGNAALAACGSLTAITVDGQNLFYCSSNGILFDQPQTTLIQFPGGSGGSYTVSNGIIRLGDTAFSGCSNLTRITIPTSVTNVGNSTFANCPQAGIYFEGNAPGITSSGSIGILPSGLFIISPIFGNNFYNPNAEAVYYLPGTTGWSATFDGLPAYLWVPPYVCTPTSNSITVSGFNGSGGAITIPDRINGLPVTAIASGAFDNAVGLGLTNVIIGTNVMTIGSYAFAACTSLTSITIPHSVTNIGSYAFTFCDNLQSVYFQGNAPSADASVFFRWSSFPIFPTIYEPPTPTTVYYLPGTTGWGTTFGGQTTVLWDPQAQTCDASFGVRTNGFGFNITGAPNLIVVVEATPSLSSPDWQPVQTNTLVTGSTYFSDPQWTNFSGRYYRLRSP